MSIIHSAVTFETKSHMPKDQVSNSFVFTSKGGEIVDVCVAIEALIASFYNVSGGAAHLSSKIASFVDRAVPATIKHTVISPDSTTTPSTLLTPGQYGSPFRVGHFTLGPAGNQAQDLPAQIAACLSFHADTAGTSEHSGAGPRSAERRRGRLYLGPLTSDVVAVDPATGAPVLLFDGFISTLRTAALALMLNSFGAGGVPNPGIDDLNTAHPVWSLWSRKDNAVRMITGGFVDNTFDTQRRRAEVATFRTTWSELNVA